MLGVLLYRRVRWERRHVLAGVALGLANFGNILTYIRAHQSLPEHPALVFASMNMGVITLGTLVGALAFREPLTRGNLLGIALALWSLLEDDIRADRLRPLFAQPQLPNAGIHALYRHDGPAAASAQVFIAWLCAQQHGLPHPG
ncbi:hypothetical protein G6F62_014556 [Rhizopus arrhizus]|nr:hypothetical protein G6F62_014556 [Rhizopus arrhizus]